MIFKKINVLASIILIISCNIDKSEINLKQENPELEYYLRIDSIFLPKMNYVLTVYENKKSSQVDSYLKLEKITTGNNNKEEPVYIFACGSYIEICSNTNDSISYEFNLNEFGGLLTEEFSDMNSLIAIDSDMHTILKYYLWQLSDIKYKDIKLEETAWFRYDSTEKMRVQYYNNDYFLKKYKYGYSDEIQIIFSPGEIESSRDNEYRKRPKLVLLKHFAKR